jgi:hypothetical protein
VYTWFMRGSSRWVGMTKRLELLRFELEHKPRTSVRVPQRLTDGILEGLLAQDGDNFIAHGCS